MNYVLVPVWQLYHGLQIIYCIHVCPLLRLLPFLFALHSGSKAGGFQKGHNFHVHLLLAI